MMKSVSRLALVAGALALSAAAHAAEPATLGSTAKGKAYVDAKGMTLYTFDKDSSGKSACVDKCAQNWPPLKAEASAKAAGDWSVIDRADGSKQWAIKGKPLYTFVKDKKAGDAEGDGFMNGVWHIAKP